MGDTYADELGESAICHPDIEAVHSLIVSHVDDSIEGALRRTVAWISNGGTVEELRRRVAHLPVIYTPNRCTTPGHQ